jgi:UDP:flavonoid glycosyltransferase YjiC (YdhE family)
MAPNIAIANELVKMGHEVGFYTDERVRLFTQNIDIRLFPFRCLRIRQVDHIIFANQKSGSTITNPLKINTILHSWLLDTIPQQISDLSRYISEWPPDVIACDVTMWGPSLIIYEKSHIPVAIVGYTLGCMIPGEDTPPWGFGIPKPKNLRSRLTVKLIKIATQLLLTKKAITAINGIRWKYQLPPVSEPIQSLLGRMPLYIVPSIPELDYDRNDLPRSVHYVGPCLWHEPDQAERYTTKNGNRPKVCIVRDTVDTALLKLFEFSIAELTTIPVQVRTIENCQRRPEDFSSCCPISFELNDPKKTNDRSGTYDLIITTGATSTVLASLKAGIPLLVIPKEWERPENAQRVVESGVGMRLDPHNCNPQRVRETVNRILMDASYKKNALRISMLFDRYQGPARAANLLEKLAADHIYKDLAQLTHPN